MGDGMSCIQSVRGARGWQCFGWACVFDRLIAAVSRLDASTYSCIYLIKHAASMRAKLDKIELYHDLAFKAQQCALNNNFSCSFQVIRPLSGFTPRPLKSVKRKNGKMSNNELERQLRWREHFSELLGGQVDLDSQQLVPSSVQHVDDEFYISVQQTQESIESLGVKKACGIHEVPASVLKAGGCALAVKVNEIENRAVREERVPVYWTGGRLVDLYKKKADAAECSSYRGLLVSDHYAKAFIGKLRDAMTDQVKDETPCDQYGGCVGGGTDYPMHVVKSLIAYAALSSQSVFVLFIDLVSAYDSVVREVAFGFLHSHSGDQVAYLASIGIESETAAGFVEYIATNKPVLVRVRASQEKCAVWLMRCTLTAGLSTGTFLRILLGSMAADRASNLGASVSTSSLRKQCMRCVRVCLNPASRFLPNFPIMLPSGASKTLFTNILTGRRLKPRMLMTLLSACWLLLLLPWSVLFECCLMC